MCGRARCTVRSHDISTACNINNGFTSTVQMDRFRPRYNVAPGSYMPVVRREHGSSSEGVVLHCMKWGLVPSFTKKTDKPDHYKMFNARSESICEKASFRRLVPNNRCLVTVEGFYEWKKDGAKKQPYYIHFKNGQPLVFAALYDSWANSEGEVLYTFTIVTTSCSSAFQSIHDRMPVILGSTSSTETWLHGSPSSKFSTVLKPYEDSDLVWYPVTPAMGKPSFDGPECIIEIPLKAEEKNLISKFFLKKKVDEEQESNMQIENSSKEDPSECLGEDSAKIPTDSEEDYKNPKDEVSPLRYSGEEKCRKKRGFDELKSDFKPSSDNTEKLGMHVVKKKGNLKNADVKQQSLLSFFGRSS